jgi:hypothetical protein
MIILKSNRFYDTNKIGVIFVFVCIFIVSIQSTSVLLKFFLITGFSCYNYYLFQLIKKYKNINLMLNDENQWILDSSINLYKLEIKDYWILKKYLFIWLKGSNKSISLMLSRSIIGEQQFSLLRSKLK